MASRVLFFAYYIYPYFSGVAIVAPNINSSQHAVRHQTRLSSARCIVSLYRRTKRDNKQSCVCGRLSTHCCECATRIGTRVSYQQIDFDTHIDQYEYCPTRAWLQAATGSDMMCVHNRCIIIINNDIIKSLIVRYGSLNLRCNAILLAVLLCIGWRKRCGL